MPDLKPGDIGYVGLLKGKDEICRAMRITSDQFREVIRLGAPIRKLGKAFRADTRDLRKWWKVFYEKTPPISLQEIEDDEKEE